MDYLEGLNEAQRNAVTHSNGPVMVIAGAGSGKTRVLTYRIAHLIKNGVDPFNILALTFTNKAAREMKERISTIIDSRESHNIWMGTFHSIFSRILRIECDKIGYPRNFTIYDTADSRNLIKTIVKELGLDDKMYKPNMVQNRISSAKNNLISARGYNANDEITGDDRMNGRPRLGEIYTHYERRCFMSGAMDFDDLLFKTNVLLKNHPDVLHKYQHKFRHILVDEYQDTNYSQYLIVKRLAALNENLCVVGDDAQSIYAFRGANIQNILNFKKDYPDYGLYKLEQNYRSTKTIVNAANSIIEKNKDQIKKDVWTENQTGDKIKVFRALTDNEEGRMISSSIFETKQEKQAKNLDFAILYRTNAQSRSFEEALRKLNIKYRIYGGLSFYQRKEIKDILAYFRLSANNNDEEALKRTINYPKRGIGKTSIEKIVIAASQAEVGIWSVLENLSEYNVEVNNGTRTKIGEFVTMIKSFGTKLTTASAYELGSHIAGSSGILKELYNDKTPEGISRYDNIQELLNGMKEFSEIDENDFGDEADSKTLPDFLIDVALLTDADQKDEDNDKVVLMTIHAAKGLEFPYVYVVGMEENLFPSQLSLNSRADLEEERRLFYVALTRAENQATLSYATSRYRWGNLISCEPSRFIEEINPDFVELPYDLMQKQSYQTNEVFDSQAKAVIKKAGRKNEKFVPKTKRNLVKMDKTKAAPQDNNNDKIQVGFNVEHQRFGKGKVIHMEGKPPNQKATVFFPNVGQKQLLLKFAKLTILD
jgi:DNA helicase-2/ATP-dependent DNA helicase PcrA